jgi:hypothetical protein
MDVSAAVATDTTSTDVMNLTTARQFTIAGLQGWQYDDTWLRAFEEHLTAVDTVSFNVFDTAIGRIVESPRDVFGMVESALRVKYGDAAAGFAAAREAAEASARALLPAGRIEPTLGEIYAALASDHPAFAAMPVASELEQQIEQRCVVAIPDILEAYRRARLRGKRVLFLCDTYLPQALIAAMLRAEGYEGWDDLLVSSATGRTKASGSQWDVVRERRGTHARLLHVGDDPHADDAMPARTGVACLPYRRVRSEPRIGAPASPAVRAFSVARRVGTLTAPALAGPDAGMSPRFFAHFGWTFGVLVAGAFALWLAQRAKALGLRHIYFCARDGWLMYRAWNALRLSDDTGISASYLLVSRRPLVLSMAYVRSRSGVLDAQSLEALTTIYGAVPLRAALERANLALDGPAARDAIARFGSLDTMVQGSEGGVLGELFTRHAAEVIAGLQRAHEGTIGYLTQEGVIAADAAAIIDMGWHGSMQRALEDLLRTQGREGRFPALYYGLWAEHGVARVVPGFMEAFYSRDAVAPQEQPGLAGVVEMLEELHGAPHGSVTGYRRDGDRWVAELHDTAVEHAQHEEGTRHFQDAAVSGLAEIVRTGRVGTIAAADLTRETALAAIEAVGLSPTVEEMRQLGRLKHSPNFDHSTFCTIIPDDPEPLSAEALRAVIEANTSWMAGALKAALLRNADRPERQALVCALATRMLAHCDKRVLRQFS